MWTRESGHEGVEKTMSHHKGLDSEKKRSQAQEVWLRLKKNKQAMFGLVVFLTITVIAIAAPLFIDYDA